MLVTDNLLFIYAEANWEASKRSKNKMPGEMPENKDSVLACFFLSSAFSETPVISFILALYSSARKCPSHKSQFASKYDSQYE